MPPRPFHRWRSFWLGVLVLAFLGWAWGRSVHHYNSFSYGNSTGRLGIILEQRDSLLILTVPRKLPMLPGLVSLNIGLAPPRNAPQLPAPLSVGLKSPPSYRSLAIAHWFLILLFLIPWAAFLLWRSRRLKRLAAAAGEPQA